MIVDVEDLKHETNSLKEFLKLKLGVEVQGKSGKLLVEDKKQLKPREVKFQIKRFLRRENYSEKYRVIVKPDKQIKITKVKQEEKSRKEKGGIPPSAPYTMPYFYPDHPRF